MGSSAQNSSGVQWCRRRVRFRLGGFGAGARSGSAGFRRRSGRLWRKARSSSTGFRRRFRWRFGRLWRRTVQVRCNRVAEKVPGKVWEALVQSQVRSGRLFGADPAEVFPALGKNKTLRPLRIPPKLIFLQLHRLSIELRHAASGSIGFSRQHHTAFFW